MAVIQIKTSRAKRRFTSSFDWLVDLVGLVMVTPFLNINYLTIIWNNNVSKMFLL